ncbi:MAG: thiamine-phosphate kinase [Dehalococcoidales bacterium]|nr:thiamine-phosphate kinase [Dehalococcoidales bacterium]
MKVSELGEFGLINQLAKMVSPTKASQTPWPQPIIGIGDDAAVWQGDNRAQMVTVDAFIENIHFSRQVTPWNELGWKALAVNLSDIAAMGGIPRYAVVSLAIPNDTEVADVTALYRGMIKLARQSGVAIIGGDSCSAPEIIINITVVGSALNQANHILTRAGANPGDSIAVTGYLGAAAAGGEMLAGKLLFSLQAASQLRQAFLHPSPRLAEGQLLVNHGIRSATDISDGLLSDLNHICRASQLGARLNIDAIPVHPAVKNNLGDRALELALSGGEDYELLFTGNSKAINNLSDTASCPITVIGEMVADKAQRIILIDHQGNPVKFDRMGWEHFTKQ